MTRYSINITEEQSISLERLLIQEGWNSYNLDHTIFAYKKDKNSIILYTKKRNLFIQGKDMENFILNVFEEKITKEKIYGRDEELNPQYYECHAGIDESGKCDYFGLLVSACVIADRTAIKHWLANGLKESKKASDKKVLELAKMIRNTKNVVIETSFYDMQTYNNEYTAISKHHEGALTYLLADLHANAIKKALAKKSVPWGMLDQYIEDESIVKSRLDGVKDFNLKMETKAERDPIVAAASIIARAEFLEELYKSSAQAGIELKKGSTFTDNELDYIVEKIGVDNLPSFAKMDFAPIKEALERAKKANPTNKE